jgi:[protein-PII] uridylyltransferase
VNNRDYAWLFDTEAFKQALQTTDNPLPIYKEALNNTRERLEAAFDEGRSIEQLILGRAWLVDQVLQQAWQQHMPAPFNEEIALIAVGGYGRGELHPASDIDLLILLAGPECDTQREALGGFITFLWDIGLEVGHSVRSMNECLAIAKEDVSVITNLIETRLISGNAALFQQLRNATDADQLWPSRDFFSAKLDEQFQRHQRFHDTAYNLEPNVKDGPGGLRDIQMIGWVTKRHFGAENLHELVTHNFLTEEEYQRLIECQNFLWRVRFALHTQVKRKEERLLFDYQTTIADKFNFEDETADKDKQATDTWSRAADGHRLGVELFMKKYYRTIMELRSLNDILLQSYQEAILHKDDSAQATALNRRFQVHKGFIETVDDKVFERHPYALLEIFLLLQQHPEIKGIRAATSRLMRLHAQLIDDNFRQDIRCKSLFMEILKQPRGITYAVRNLTRYGIMAGYIPAFSKIIGQMQYDLYHAYTVDQHTLFVVRNLRRFSIDNFADEFPLCSEIIKQIPKPELLYLAGLFHDIAKGRGGDHSILGAEDVRTFGQQHGLSKYDTELVAWLVESHLLMSAVAQHKDISDPEVVNSFASQVGDFHRLDYLYLLTVADMRATNPKLWNGWKDSLLVSLYKQTKRALARGLENPMDREDRIRETKVSAGKQLQTKGADKTAVNQLWQSLSDDYFLRYHVDEIIWHTQELINHPDQKTLVATRTTELQGVSQFFIYAPRRTDLFARITATLEQQHLNIVEARIVSNENHYALDTYSVLEKDGTPIDHSQRLTEIKETLHQKLAAKSAIEPRRRDASRQVRHFSIDTEISFTNDLVNNRTIMEVISTDCPGLLARIASALVQFKVEIQNAKISTFGAQAEDVFFLTDHVHQPVRDAQLLQKLKQAIVNELDED